MNARPIKKYFFIVLGSISLALGFIGIFLPILPTTPFLLLASYCYVRSSQRMHDWLIQHRLFGRYIYNYLTYKAVPKKSKVNALIFLWLTLSFSIYLVPSVFLKLLLAAIGLGVSFHISTLKNLTPEMLHPVKTAPPETEAISKPDSLADPP